MTARCVECRELPGVYWDKSFCVDCYEKVLKSGEKRRGQLWQLERQEGESETAEVGVQVETSNCTSIVLRG